MNFSINNDGSFDISGKALTLRNAYPGIDGRALMPTGIEVGPSSVKYNTVTGSILLSFSYDGNTLLLNTSFSGCAEMGHFSPVFNADLAGAERFFTQGYKFGGPTQLMNICDIDGFSDSHGIAAIGHDDRFCVIHTCDFSHYINRIRLLRRNPTVHTNDALPKLSVDFQLEYENSADVSLPVLKFDETDNLYTGLREAACDIAGFMKARVSDAPMFLWNSWYYLYQNVSEEKLLEYSKAFSECKERFPFKYMVIDSGYYPSQGDWLIPNHRFPGGLRQAAKLISDAGYLPGIWCGVFMVGDESKLFKEHPDWLLHDKTGMPLVLRKTYSAGIWGQPDHFHYALDTSHPEAMDYIRNVFRTLYSYGYRLFKTDFINWGVHDSDKVSRHTPGKTSIEYLRDLLAVIREEIHESYLLGCISPLFPFIGYADGMRIGDDVGPQWTEEGKNPINMLRESVGDSYFNNIFWHNDPDVVMLRDFNIALKPGEVTALALFQAFSGGIVGTSDPIHRLAEDRRELLEFIRPDLSLHTPGFPFFGELRDDIVMTQTLDGGRSMVLLFNKTERDITVGYDTAALGIKSKYLMTYDGIQLPPTEIYTARIPAHGCILLFASDSRLTVRPANLWRW